MVEQASYHAQRCGRCLREMLQGAKTESERGALRDDAVCQFLLTLPNELLVSDFWNL